jgi:3-hydroxybutyrate dehydrogenase
MDASPRRSALVTGSTGGLGYAVAESLAAVGHDVVLHGIDDPEVVEPARSALQTRHGGTVGYCRADLSRLVEVERLMSVAHETCGGPDIVVNNAVVRHFGPIERFSAADWQLSLDVNLTAPFHIIRLALPGMRAADFGRIVNMSSHYGQRGAQSRVDYVTTKTGILGLTRAVALETVGTGITCNAVSPGTLPTAAIVNRIDAIAAVRGISRDEATQDYMRERQPSRRFVRPEDVGAAVAFLCSPAARDITGAVIPIDGGWSAA